MGAELSVKTYHGHCIVVYMIYVVLHEYLMEAKSETLRKELHNPQLDYLVVAGYNICFGPNFQDMTADCLKNLRIGGGGKMKETSMKNVGKNLGR